MKAVIGGIVCVVFLSLCAPTVRAAEPAPTPEAAIVDLPEGYVNVMDYITKVGNRTNHTEAIRMAFQSRDKDKAGGAGNGVGNRWFGVYFPPGTYLVDDTIDIDYTRVVGNGATITGTNPEKDIFRATHYMVSVEGITFRGGRDHIHVETSFGASGSLWSINNCHFFHASGRAIFLSGNMFYAVIDHGTVAGCKNGILYANGDGVTIRDFHGETLGQTNAAAFDVRTGFFIMEDCLWTPGTTHPDARWIDNRSGMLFLKHVHFGGESDGFTPVVNYMKPSGSVIHLDSCCFYAQSNLGKKAVVYCEEVPEVIHIEDCQIGGIEPIMVSPKIDLKNYFVEVNQPLRPSYRIESCAGYLGDVPENLKNPVVHKDVRAFLDDAKIKELMAEAVKSVAAMETSEKPGECVEPLSQAKRTEPTDPARYVKASFGNCVMEGTADGEMTPNANYFAIQPVGENLIIMKRQPATGNAWVFRKGFTVDLDKYPILSRKVKSAGSYRVKSPFPPVRIIDRATGKMIQFGDDNPYSAINLRKAFGGGVHTLDFRLYWDSMLCCWLGIDVEKTIAKVGKEYFDAVAKECPGTLLPPGTYMVYDYLRAEAE